MNRICFLLLFLLFFAPLFGQQDSLGIEEGEELISIFDEPDPQDLWAPIEIIPVVEISFPTGSFKNDLGKVPVGFGFGISYRMKKYPVNLGLYFGDFLVGRVKRDIQDTLAGDNFPAKLKETLVSRAWNMGGIIHFEPNWPLSFQPYFEGAFGPQRFFTRRRLRVAGFAATASGDSRDLDWDVLHSNWGWSFSGAVGAKINLYQNYLLSLDLQAGYRQGTTANFHIKTGNSKTVPDPLDNFRLREAPVSLFFGKIGLAILLAPDE